MPKNNKWSAEEDSLLLKEVKANPKNLKVCFLIVSAKTGRTEHAVMEHWYKVVKNKTKNPIVIKGSTKVRKYTEAEKQTLLSRIINFFKNI